MWSLVQVTSAAQSSPVPLWVVSQEDSLVTETSADLVTSVFCPLTFTLTPSYCVSHSMWSFSVLCSWLQPGPMSPTASEL